MTAITKSETPTTPLTEAQLNEARTQEVLDKDGNKVLFGDLIKDKRTAIIFIRHFWCLNCQAYVRGIADSIPPQNLPEDTQVIVIGCGSYQPISTYVTNSHSPYPIYANPSLSLYHLFQFNATLAGAAKGEEPRDYMKSLADGYWGRVWSGVKKATSTIGDVRWVGPKDQNGGEVVIGPDGKCEWIYRMQNTADHTNIHDLAKVLGAKYDEPKDIPEGTQSRRGSQAK